MAGLSREEEVNIWKTHQLEAEINKDLTEYVVSMGLFFFLLQRESGFTVKANEFQQFIPK